MTKTQFDDMFMKTLRENPDIFILTDDGMVHLTEKGMNISKDDLRKLCNERYPNG